MADYSLLRREDGSAAWVFRNSFDKLPDSAFWLAKFIPRFDSKHENGIINNALKSALSFASSTSGQTSMLSPELGGMIYRPLRPASLVTEK